MERFCIDGGPELTAIRVRAMSADGCEIFFSSRRVMASGDDVYRATRSNVSLPFDAPQLVPELSSMLDDLGERLARDGHTMYLNYDSVRNGGQNSDIWISTRTCL